MDVAERLDALRAEAPGIDLAAFADMSSGMVLCVSAANRRAQEEMDALNGIAITLLDGQVADGANGMLGQVAPDTALTTTAMDARIFLRSPKGGSEALICVCAPDADLEKILDCGRSALAGIVAAG